MNFYMHLNYTYLLGVNWTIIFSKHQILVMDPFVDDVFKLKYRFANKISNLSSFKYIHDFILARLCLLCKHRTIFFLVFSLIYIRYILFRVKLYDKIIKNCERMKSNFRKIDNTNSRIFKYFGLVLHVSGALMRSSRETLNNHCNQITG